MWKTSVKRPVENNEDDGEDENKAYTMIKCALATIIRPKYRSVLSDSIAAKSIMSTKICALASLLFLHKSQTAYDNGHQAFFNQDGYKVIKKCFHGVLQQNIYSEMMPAPFREFVDNLHQQYRFQWPKNTSFGNGLGDQIKTYTTNVTTNLKTHCKKRLVQFLKLKAFKHNTQPNPMFKYLPSDIDNVIKYLIDKKDIEIKCNGDTVKQFRRDWLLEHVRRISWWDIEQHNLFECKDENWFKSIPMWIAMQREIDEFNLSKAAAQPQQPGFKTNSKKSKKNSKKSSCQKKKPRRWQPRQKQLLDNPNDPPEIRNLVVIPICSFKRTHYPIDNFTLFRMLGQHRLLPRNGKAMIKFKQFMANKDTMWNEYFYMRKIRWFVRRKKQFSYRILSDGIAVSMQYKSAKSQSGPIDLNKVRTDYRNKKYKKVLGIDPGENKWNTTVQRDLETGKEVNFKINSKQYHWKAGRRKRKSKEDRWTGDFKVQEQSDLNDRTLYPVMPSPLGQNWLHYVHHRLKMLKDGIDAYASPQYTRLALDKYIESTRAVDQIIGKLTNNEPSIVFLGNGETPPNSPIKIKKHTRCPGTRKLVNSFKKRSNCVVLSVDEYFTSQTCAKCFGRFDVTTKKNKFKICQDCQPKREAMLPSKIVTQLGKRSLQAFRKIEREEMAERSSIELGEPVAKQSINSKLLLSKVKTYRKIWQMNTVTGEIVNAAAEHLFEFEDELDAYEVPHKTVWQRDVVAAKCIMLKGLCTLFDRPIPVTLQRPAGCQPNQPNQP